MVQTKVVWGWWRWAEAGSGRYNPEILTKYVTQRAIFMLLVAIKMAASLAPEELLP